MSKKICFSSVLKEKRGVQNVLNKPVVSTSLREIMEQFTDYPNQDYFLSYSQSTSLKTCNSKQGFQEGYNQLDQWIHNQIHSNKQNISDTQPRRQIPNELLKYAQGGNKSPRKLNQVKSDFIGTQTNHRNADMKEIYREYAENKKSGRDMGKDGPVWRFSSKHSEQAYEEEEPRQINRRSNRNYGQSSNIMMAESKKQEDYNEDQFFQQKNTYKSQNQPSKTRTERNSNIIRNNSFQNQIQTQSQTQSQHQSQSQNQHQNQNILKLVQQIKSNIVPEIQVMAQRIINQRTLGQQQDQELLLSQRQSESQKDQKRIEKAKKQIGEYLTMKNPSEQRQQQISIKKTHDDTFENINQKITSSDNQHVGYSFSSDFQGQNVNNLSVKDTSSYSGSANQQQVKMKKGSQIYLNPANKISLPNIDQVKSERDALQKIQQDFTETISNKLGTQPKQQPSEIDKNFIKQIQSVAYVQPTQTEYKQTKVQYYLQQPMNAPKQQFSNQRQPLQNQKQSIDKKGSLFNQISKTAMSINEGTVNQIEEVNISIAEGKQGSKNNSRNGSAKNNSCEKNNKVGFIAPEVNSFVTPASTVKIQFKKVPSPERNMKRDQIENGNQPPNATESKSSGSYFARVYTPSTNSITNPVYKTSFANVIQESENLNQKPVVSIQQGSTPTNTVNNAPKTSITFINQPSTSTSIPSATPSVSPSIVPTTTFTYTTPTPALIQPSSSSISQLYHQNSRQRNNSMKNSNQDESKKIKITISPKYHGNQAETRQQLVTPVADFRLGPKMQESTQSNLKTQTGYTNQNQSYNTAYTNQTTIIPVQPSKSSLTLKAPSQQSFSGTRFKVDAMFSNTTTVNGTTITQMREIHEQKRQRGEQQAMLKTQKIERIEVKESKNIAKQSISSRNKESIKSSQQFQFDLDF